ncbi:MAG TPA: hypothetical protein VJ346_02555 [Bacteroidales bacterium]|nr:hypothetical protein [Bacteroidales bacterium]
MTRKIIYILLLTTGLFVLTSKSCEPDIDMDEEARLKAEQESTLKEIKNEFESEYLFEDRLMAYGEKAKQKLVDFTDYLSLYSGKDLDTLFRQQVKDMIYKLFYEKDAMIQLSVVLADNTGDKENNLTGLLSGIEASNYQSIGFAISDQKIIEPLHLESTERYTGKIGCCFWISGITEKDTTLLSETINQVKMIATRISKQFGDETSLQVWQVFLYDIETIK